MMINKLHYSTDSIVKEYSCGLPSSGMDPDLSRETSVGGGGRPLARMCAGGGGGGGGRLSKLEDSVKAELL